MLRTQDKAIGTSGPLTADGPGGSLGGRGSVTTGGAMEAGDGGSRIGRRWLAVVSLVFAALLSACGSSDDPLPSSMCPEGSAPQVVAYEFDGGGVEWVSCTDEIGYWSLLPVADGVVYVATYSQGVPSNVTALDAATGEPIDDAPPPPPARGTVEGQPYTGQPARVEVGDITVIGGQDDGGPGHLGRRHLVVTTRGLGLRRRLGDRRRRRVRLRTRGLPVGGLRGRHRRCAVVPGG